MARCRKHRTEQTSWELLGLRERKRYKNFWEGGKRTHVSHASAPSIGHSPRVLERTGHGKRWGEHRRPRGCESTGQGRDSCDSVVCKPACTGLSPSSINIFFAYLACFARNCTYVNALFLTCTGNTVAVCYNMHIFSSMYAVYSQRTYMSAAFYSLNEEELTLGEALTLSIPCSTRAFGIKYCCEMATWGTYNNKTTTKESVTGQG